MRAKAADIAGTREARHDGYPKTDLADAVQHMRDQGKPVPDVLLAQTSPLIWEHIGFSDDFRWDCAAATADRRRPLNVGRAGSPHGQYQRS